MSCISRGLTVANTCELSRADSHVGSADVTMSRAHHSSMKKGYIFDSVQATPVPSGLSTPVPNIPRNCLLQEHLSVQLLASSRLHQHDGSARCSLSLRMIPLRMDDPRMPSSAASVTIQLTPLRSVHSATCCFYCGHEGQVLFSG